MTRTRFLRTWEQLPNLNNAELLEGIVYVASPLRLVQHGRPHVLWSNWIGSYAARTPGLDFGDNTTLLLDTDNVPQPDLLLRLPEGAGGTSRITDEGFLSGPPELIVEVAASSVSLDLHAKKDVYRRHAVAEYLVHRVEERAVDWWEHRDGLYEPIPVDEADGLLKSRRFPGLWLDGEALLNGDLPALLAAVERGCETDEHQAFVASLSAEA